MVFFPKHNETESDWIIRRSSDSFLQRVAHNVFAKEYEEQFGFKVPPHPFSPQSDYYKEACLEIEKEKRQKEERYNLYKQLKEEFRERIEYEENKNKNKIYSKYFCFQNNQN
jgi:hypothetical protein